MITLHTSDGEDLEAQWDEPENPSGSAIVLCHPHPLHGGTMNAPLMEQLTDGLVARGFAVLRFNFRGVGGSTGTHGFGKAELADVTAAWTEAVSKSSRPLLAGWSFGAATSLLWMAETGTAVDWVGIAPPVRSERVPALPENLPAAPRTFILGDRDQFASVEDVQNYVNRVGGSLEVFPGSDHFFYFREERVAEAMARAFGWRDSGEQTAGIAQ